MNELYLRKATLIDKDLLFKWTNDPLTRQNSFSTTQISYEDHCKWFETMMENENKIQYIMMDKDIAVGQIRIDIDKETAEISYSIGAEYRGKGYGKKALVLIRDEVEKNFKDVTRLIGQVKTNNEASVRAFLRAGYAEKFRQFEMELR